MSVRRSPRCACSPRPSRTTSSTRSPAAAIWRRCRPTSTRSAGSYRGGSEGARTRAGAGLGLAISRAIVEAHGGRIWLADSTAGTRVRFSLPAAA
ncbi:MAG: ATP-binding protein [Solirubrobacteraceae bacterium]